MFDHSIKVPRLYKTASKIYKDLQGNKGSIKQLVYQAKHQNIKALYALVVETHKRRIVIDSLFENSQLFTKEPRLDPILARILLTELLWGKQRLAGESKPVKTLLSYEQIFKAHLSDIAHNNSNEEICEVHKPRYVRVNTIVLSTNEAVNGFQNEDWNLVRFNDKQDYKGFLESIKSLGEYDFMVDIHIPDLLVFRPKTQFYNHSAYREGQIILQDKASCLPAFILNPDPGSTVLDMCAAPGMKTTHLAALMKNEGTIYAVEFDLKRAAVLENMLASTSVTCAKTINRDVLTITDEECPNIEYILVDPSCSGTGIIDRLNIEEHASKNEHDRISKLAGFQTKILRHALTKFPFAKRVVYSTCSLNPEENEDVVRQVLETCTTFKLVPAKQFLNNIWLNFGSSEFGKMGSYCLYTRPDTDMTNGFFIAVFERLQNGEENEFFNQKALKKLKKRNKHKDVDVENQAYNDSEANFDNEDDEAVFEINAESHPDKKKKHKTNKVYPLIDGQYEDGFSENCDEHVAPSESATNFGDVGSGEENHNSSSQKKKKHKRNQVYPTIDDQCEQQNLQIINNQDGERRNKKNRKNKETFSSNHETTSNENCHENDTNDCKSHSKKNKKRKYEDTNEPDNNCGLDNKTKKMKNAKSKEGAVDTMESNTDSVLPRKKKMKKENVSNPITEITISENEDTYRQNTENIRESESTILECVEQSKKKRKHKLLKLECDNTNALTENDDAILSIHKPKKDKKSKKM